MNILPEGVPSGAECLKGERRTERGELGLGSVSKGRWESSWVPLGLDHMCLRGVGGGSSGPRGQEGAKRAAGRKC